MKFKFDVLPILKNSSTVGKERERMSCVDNILLILFLNLPHRFYSGNT